MGWGWGCAAKFTLRLQVGKTSEENFALSKAQFANYVLDNNPGFDNFDITGFLPVFQLIEDMLIKNKDNKK